MATLSLTPNYSVYAIPAFWVLCMAPQFYGNILITKANNGNFDNTNPRGADFQTSLKSSVPSATLATYERAKGAHTNSLEALPLIVGAVLAGNVAHVDPAVMNTVCGLFLALRVLYVPIYIGVTKQKYSRVRTAV